MPVREFVCLRLGTAMAGNPNYRAVEKGDWLAAVRTRFDLTGRQRACPLFQQAPGRHSGLSRESTSIRGPVLGRQGANYRVNIAERGVAVSVT